MKHVISIVLSVGIALAARGADKQPFKITGLYTETCACSAPCKCELTGDVPSSCQGVGAFKITSGTYGGQDISVVSMAYAGKPGKWIRLYIDAPDKAHRDAAEKFGRAAYARWGVMEAVKDAKVEIAGDYGAYTVTVDGGATMKYVTVPVLGADGKTAVTHGNTFDPLTSAFLQGKSAVQSTYHDETRSMELPQGRNVYFNDKMDTSGQL